MRLRSVVLSACDLQTDCQLEDQKIGGLWLVCVSCCFLRPETFLNIVSLSQVYKWESLTFYAGYPAMGKHPTQGEVEDLSPVVFMLNDACSMGARGVPHALCDMKTTGDESEEVVILLFCCMLQ